MHLGFSAALLRCLLVSDFLKKGEAEYADAYFGEPRPFLSLFFSGLQSVTLSVLFMERVKWMMTPAGEPNKSFALSAALNHLWQYCFPGTEDPVGS